MASDLLTLPHSSYQSERGGDEKMGGARIVGTQYINDGSTAQPMDLSLMADLRLTNLAYHKWWNERLANASTGYKFTREDLATMPITDIRDAISLLPGVYQARHGDDLSIFGARSGGTQYIVDGMRR